MTQIFLFVRQDMMQQHNDADILVNNAGIQHVHPLESFPVASLQHPCNTPATPLEHPCNTPVTPL
jgi:short-subunit dehydrogenase